MWVGGSSETSALSTKLHNTSQKAIIFTFPTMVIYKLRELERYYEISQPRHDAILSLQRIKRLWN